MADATPVLRPSRSIIEKIRKGPREKSSSLILNQPFDSGCLDELCDAMEESNVYDICLKTRFVNSIPSPDYYCFIDRIGTFTRLTQLSFCRVHVPLWKLSRLLQTAPSLRILKCEVVSFYDFEVSYHRRSSIQDAFLLTDDASESSSDDGSESSSLIQCLEVFELSDFRFDDMNLPHQEEEFNKFLSFLSDLESLKHVSIAYFRSSLPFPTEGISELILCSQSLETLKLAHLSFTDSDWENLASSFNRATASSWPKSRTLKTISIRDNSVEGRMVDEVSQADHQEAIAEFVSALFLRCDESLECFCFAKNGLRRWPSISSEKLKKLFLTENHPREGSTAQLFMPGNHSLPALQFLCLGDCRLSRADCLGIAEALTNHRTLLSLVLGGNRTSPEVYRAFVKALETNRILQTLDLSCPSSYLPNAAAYNECHDDIIRMLQSNHTLERFYSVYQEKTCDDRYQANIESYLLLNRRGFGALLSADDEDAVRWVHLLIAVRSNEEAAFRVLKTKPGLCLRQVAF